MNKSAAIISQSLTQHLFVYMNYYLIDISSSKTNNDMNNKYDTVYIMSYQISRLKTISVRDNTETRDLPRTIIKSEQFPSCR